MLRSLPPVSKRKFSGKLVKPEHGKLRPTKSGPSCATGATESLMNIRIWTCAEWLVRVGVVIMDEELLETAARFAEPRGLTLRQPLGDGIHGIVFAPE